MNLKDLGKEAENQNNTWLAQWETRVKLVTCAAIAFLLVPVKNPGALGGYAVFLFALLFLARIPLRKVLQRLLLLLPFLIFISVPVLFGGGLPPPPARVELALLLMLKAVCTVFLLFIIIFTQPVRLIFNGVGQMHLPDKLVSVLFLSWRYVFLFWEKLSQTHKALHSRLFRDWTNIGAYKTYGEIIGGLFVKSIDSSERVYKAMLSRGYTGKTVAAAARKITCLDLVKSVLMLLSSLALYFV